MLSTLGIKTNKFNDLISKKVSETRNINLKLNSVKFKINLKSLAISRDRKSKYLIQRGIDTCQEYKSLH